MDKKTLFFKCVSFTTSVHRVTNELTKNAKSDSVTPLQYDILEYITVSQPVTLSEISDCKQISMPNTSREIRKLSEKNLVEKINDSEDRRKQYIRLTKEGQTMMNKSFASIESRFLEKIQNASEKDLEEIGQAFDILQSKIFF